MLNKKAGNKIGDETIQDLKDNSGSFNLTQLNLGFYNLDNCNITNVSSDYISYFISQNIFIESISLLENYFNEFGAEILGKGYSNWYKRNKDMIKKKEGNITLFLIEENLLKIILSDIEDLKSTTEKWTEEKFTSRFIIHIIEELQKKDTDFKSLIISNQHLRDQEFISLSRSVENIELEEIKLESNEFNFPEILSLFINSIKIEGNNLLKKISFSGNKISDRVMEEMVNKLSLSTTLEKLYLSKLK